MNCIVFATPADCFHNDLMIHEGSDDVVNNISHVCNLYAALWRIDFNPISVQIYNSQNAMDLNY